MPAHSPSSPSFQQEPAPSVQEEIHMPATSIPRTRQLHLPITACLPSAVLHRTGAAWGGNRDLIPLDPSFTLLSSCPAPPPPQPGA
eukprot:449858-Hanusia_phi.AAC.1